MGIEVVFDFAKLAQEAMDSSQDRIEAITAGGLDDEQVYFQYHTQHDGRVRPSHRALDGTVWKLGDVLAPVPPIDYGCRCYMEYVAKPGTVAARLLPEATTAPTTKAAAFAKHLTDILPGWEKLAEAALDKPQAERVPFLVESLRAAHGVSDARDLAAMILEASAVIQKKGDNG